MKAFSVGDRIFGGFLVSEQVDEGAFGETWKCRNEISGRLAILKGIKKDLLESKDPNIIQLDLNTRVREEAKILTALFDKKYGFVPNVYDVFEVNDGRIFFLSEFIEGRLFSDVIIDNTISDELRAKFAFDLMTILKSIHSNGIVHRDVAPDNLILKHDNTLCLIDFGLSKIKKEILVRKYSKKTQIPITKIKYMPHYAFDSIKDGKTLDSTEGWDLFAAGVIIYELFTRELYPGMQFEATEEEIHQIPCGKTIKHLTKDNLKGQQVDAAKAINSIFLEFEENNLGIEIMKDKSDFVVDSLKQEVSDLKQDLKKGRQKTTWNDIINYTARLKLIFKTHPGDKVITIEGYHEGTLMNVIIDYNDWYIEFTLPKLRVKRNKKNLISSLINNHNTRVILGKYVYDDSDGEIRYVLRLPFFDEHLSFEDFQKFFFITVETGSTFIKDFNNVFSKS